MDLKTAFTKIARLVEKSGPDVTYLQQWQNHDRPMAEIVGEIYRTFDWARELSTGELHLIINALIVGFSGGDPIPWLLADPEKTLASYDQETRLLEDVNTETPDDAKILRHSFKFYRAFYHKIQGLSDMPNAVYLLDEIQEIRKRQTTLNH